MKRTTILWRQGKFRVEGFAILALFLLGSQLAGQGYIQSFSSPEGGLPTNWQIGAGHNSSNGIAEIRAVPSTTDHALYQERTNGGNGNSWVYFNGSFDHVQNGVLSDFTASAVLRTTVGNGFRGMIVRAQGNAANISGYYIGVNRQSSGSTLEIRKDPSSAGGLGTLLQSVALPNPFPHHTDMHLVIDAIGDVLTGSLYAWNDGDSSYSTLVQTVTISDSSYSEGLFGFRSGFSTNTQNAYWRDLEIVTAIPEASTAALAVIMGLLGVIAWRRTRTS